MLDRQNGNHVFECDSCDEVLDTECGKWSAAKFVFDNAGWKSRQIGNDWLHGCPKHGSFK